MHQHLLLFTLLSVSPVTLAEPSAKADLEVLITGFSNHNGKAMVALSNSRDNYEARKDGEKPFRSEAIKVNASELRVVFKNVPYGEYAVKVFHDENDNNELDTNFLGIPTETYGFSNNASGAFGPADYADARFSFNMEQTSISIRLE